MLLFTFNKLQMDNGTSVGVVPWHFTHFCFYTYVFEIKNRIVFMNTPDFVTNMTVMIFLRAVFL